jgi:hypothetical protein
MSKKEQKFYSNGKIYKIINLLDETKIYVGSTCKLLCQRMATHRQDAKNKNLKLYLEMRASCINNFKIILIENYQCNNKEELRRREQYWIEQLKPFYNNYKAFQTEEQLKASKQTIEYKENMKKYRLTEKYKSYQKNYSRTEKYKENKKIYQQTEKYKENKKIYQQTEKYKEKKKIYYINKKFEKLVLESNKKLNLIRTSYKPNFLF